MSDGAHSATVAVSGAVGERVRLSGVWTVHTLHLIEAPLRRVAQSVATTSKASGVRYSGGLVFDLEGLTRMDTAGALIINETAAFLRAGGLAVTLATSNERHRELLEKTVPPHDDEDVAASVDPSRPARFFSFLGKEVLDELWMAGQLIGFLGHFLVRLSGLLLHPSRVRWTSLIFHMEQTGLRAVPIVGLLTFLIGMVVAYMGAEELARFGAQVFAVNLLEVTIMREMGVLITAIVVAGRSSSSFTAQIGAMVANEEVAALRSMGLDPMLLLVTPRVLGLMLTLPMLVFIADIMALLGGACAVWYSMDLDFGSFLVQFHNVAKAKNFFVGMIKTPFFALIIGIVGCFQGFRATSSAESVGFLTTIAVVEAIFIVIVMDALFAIFFTTIGI